MSANDPTVTDEAEPIYDSSTPEPSALKEIWEYRRLLRSLVLRNMKVKYQRSVLGFAWTLLSPLMMVGVLVAVFGSFVRVGIGQYWAFLISGFFLWSYMTDVVTAGSHLLLSHSGLRRSVVFPGQILILGAAISRMVEFVLELAIVLIVLVIFVHGGVPLSFVLLPLLLVLPFVMAVGLGLLFATLSCYFDDVRHSLPVLIRAMFYVSPIFYSVEMVPESVRSFYLYLNPGAVLLTLYQTVLYEGRWPSLTLLGAGVGSAALVTLVCYRIAGRHKHAIVELA